MFADFGFGASARDTAESAMEDTADNANADHENASAPAAVNDVALNAAPATIGSAAGI